jgi:hypothetical protein
MRLEEQETKTKGTAAGANERRFHRHPEAPVAEGNRPQDEEVVGSYKRLRMGGGRRKSLIRLGSAKETQRLNLDFLPMDLEFLLSGLEFLPPNLDFLPVDF